MSANRRYCWSEAFVALVVVIVIFSSSSAQEICDPTGVTQSENFVEVPETTEIDDILWTVTVFGDEDRVDLRGRYIDYFAFDRRTRNIIVNATLDSEVIKETLHRLYIECTDKVTTRKVTILFLINLVDVNDNPPIFTKNVYNISIGETIRVSDTIITGVLAVDDDSTPAYNQVYYTIEPSQYSDYFSLVDSTVPNLILLKPLDYETLREFSITMTAKDYFIKPSNGNQSVVGFNDTCQVDFLVEDEDDQYPVFNSSVYRAVVSDRAPLNSPVVVTPPIAAYDPDPTLRVKIHYSFHEAAGEIRNLFSIDSLTGNVTLLKRPTMEDIYLLVQATQEDNPSRYGVALLTIKVQGSNVNAPSFTRLTYQVTTTEAFPVGQTIASVLASDKEGSPVSYNLQDNTQTFSINSANGDITLLKYLNYEKQPTVSILVLASDGELTSTAEVFLKVFPADNQPPRFLTSDLNVTAIRRKGEVVLDIDAFDPDTGDTVYYNLLNHKGLFSIDSEGRIRIVSETEALLSDTYLLTVVISDGRQPSFERPAIVTVRFPPLESPVASASVASCDMIVFILGGVVAVLVVVIIVLIVYIMRNRFKYMEHLDRAKKQYPSQDPKALAFKKKTFSRKSKLDRIEFREDEGRDGATSVQENPLNANSKGSYFNFGQVHSDTDTEVDPNEIRVETSVVPYDHHRNDDNNNTDNVYNNSQYSVDSDDYNSIDKNVLNTFYRNGSLSTYRESSGSETSLNTSPTDSADSKKILVPGGTSAIHKTRIPEENGGYWEVQDSSSSIPTVTTSANSDPAYNNTQPAPQKSELTVYF